MSSSGPTKLLKLIALLSILGLGISAVSLYHHTAQRYGLQTSPSFCNLSEHVNCDAVNASPFSMILGVPLASLGMVFYILFLYGAVLGLGRDLVSQRVLAGILALFGLASVLFSVYLFVVSELLIKALCILCLALYLINISLFVCAWKLWPGGDASGRLGVGVRTILYLPKTFFDSSARRVAIAWVTILVGGIASFGAIAAPDFMVKFIVAAAQHKAEQEASAGLTDWKKQPIVDLSVTQGGLIEKDYDRGPSTAPVQIVEFSDYECPACRSFAPIVDRIIETYGDRVHFVSKNFPLDRSCNSTLKFEMHRFACAAAFFARCAGEQGKFWEAHSLLFGLDALESAENIGQLKSSLNKAGKALGLDMGAVDECVASERYKKKIDSDVEAATKVGLRGTPSFWINGRQVASPGEGVIVSIIESILGK